MAMSMALGPAFDAWKTKHEQSDQRLAEYLNVPISTLSELATLSVPGEQTAGFRGIDQVGYSGGPVTPQPGVLDALEAQYGVNAGRLYDIFLGVMEPSFDED